MLLTVANPSEITKRHCRLMDTYNAHMHALPSCPVMLHSQAPICYKFSTWGVNTTLGCHAGPRVPLVQFTQLAPI